MKYCPSCQITYADESLRFCLQDGTELRETLENVPMPTVEMRELETIVRQTPVTSGWEQNRVTQGAAIEPEVKKSNTLLTVIVTALVMCIFFGGLAVGWLLLSDKGAENKNLSGNKTENTNKTNARPMTQVNTDEDKQNKKPNSSPDGIGWEPIDNNASLNGERLTYYRGTTVEQCQADCAANPNCKAFTLIRAGAYNPQDPPMCYLLSKFTGSTPHSCCISGIKK